MTSKEKAKQLYNKYSVKWHADTEDVKYYCLICVDEIIDAESRIGGLKTSAMLIRIKYWESVKEEINNL